MNQPWYYWISLKTHKTHFATNKNKSGRSQEHTEALKENAERSQCISKNT